MSSWDPPQPGDHLTRETPASAVPAAPAKRRSKRPKFGFVVIALIALRLGREVLERAAFARFGFIGFIGVAVAGVAIVVGWRMLHRRKVARQGGEELTDEQIRRQIVDSGLEPPAFAEDGSLLGASILVVNQRTKLIEVNTEYDVFGASGRRLGHIEQIGQSRAKRVMRVVTSLDQYFTHHFEIFDADDRMVLRLTRPRKVFLTKVHVFDAGNQFVGTIRQENVFGKIRFELVNERRETIGALKASNLKAWDFAITDRRGVEVAAVVKSWEGWARTAFTRADRFVVRVNEPLAEPLRSLTVAAAMSVDLALKQDARSFG
jgi:hypothetical protein